jgi:hypothetical protein
VSSGKSSLTLAQERAPLALLVNKDFPPPAHRQWDFCDKCLFFVPCLKPERKKGDGCGAFESYPWELK